MEYIKRMTGLNKRHLCFLFRTDSFFTPIFFHLYNLRTQKITTKRFCASHKEDYVFLHVRKSIFKKINQAIIIQTRIVKVTLPLTM